MVKHSGGIWRRIGIRRQFGFAAGIFVVSGIASPAAAQKDYYNTDKDRPVRIEDAYTTERYALEVKVAPLRLERESGGLYNWGFDPEIAYGILPRTSIELGLPFAFIDGGDGSGRRSGLSGIELSAFHNLNVETRTVPALGLRGDMTFPVGSLSGDDLNPSLTAVATRTYSWARFHTNLQYTFGSEDERVVSVPDPGTGLEGSTPHEATRWLAGIAVDRSFPLNAMLLIADVYAQQPMDEHDDIEWNAGAGVRYQINPYLAVDAGLGKRLTADGAWYVTFGSAYHLGIRALMPRPR